MSVARAAALSIALFAISLAPAVRADEAKPSAPEIATNPEAGDAGSAPVDDVPDAIDAMDASFAMDPTEPSAKDKGRTDRVSLTDELSSLQPTSTPSSPAGASYANNLQGVITLTDRWSLDLGFLLTSQQGAPAPPGSIFADSGGHVSLFTIGADWDTGDHWSVDIITDLSPKTTTNSSSTIVTALGMDGGPVSTVDSRLEVTSSNADLQLGAAYDTNGDSNAEWTVAATLTAGALDSDQRVTGIENRETQRQINQAALQAICAAHPRVCGKALTAALKDQDAKLDSLKLDLGVTLTAFEDTDITLSGDYYAYLQDPSQVGYYNVATAGRALAGGAGVPIAPLRIDWRLDLLHRFGDFSAKLWFSSGSYAVDEDGITYSAGLKLQYKFSHTFRLWLSASVQHDVDDTGTDLITRGLSLGGGWRF